MRNWHDFALNSSLLFLLLSGGLLFHSVIRDPFRRYCTTVDSLELEVDKSSGHAVPNSLFGIFFEEINHAGEGGIYAEMVNDRSFEGLAYESGFLSSSAAQITLPFPLPPREDGVNPRGWHAPVATTLKLTKEAPLNEKNLVALNMSATKGDAVVFNDGFWGIGVESGKAYHLCIYLQGNSMSVRVSIEGHTGDQAYASATFTNITDSWRRYSAVLRSNATDRNARLAIRAQGRGPLFVDFASLFPEENGPAGSISPYKAELLQLLKDLNPKTVRLPGGCYVEGKNLSDAFYWRPSIGAPERRPGHWNGPWRYWSTDGLGLYEYMQLAEELGAEAVWVMNNGLSHEESVQTSDILPLIKNALASLEFVKGSSDSKWGSVRAELGRTDPWQLNYVALGNEDCGKPYYSTNYLAFYEAIHALYPEMRLIANCNMGDSAPTDLWDWHWYTDSPSMFAGRFVFDDVSKEVNASIYASEYAVFDWGIPTSPGGNLLGALAEAGFMTGLERNSHTVEMAAFAPLLVHANHTKTCPSNLIVFDGSRSFGSPSYHVQALFSQYQGQKYLETVLQGGDTPDNSVAASTVCLDIACDNLAIKVVNFKAQAQDVVISITGHKAANSTAKVITLTANNPLDSNSLENPKKVFPVTSFATFEGPPAVTVPAWSLTVINLRLLSSSTSAR